MICLSKISLEYDLYISSLKKKLIITKAKSIRNECNKFKEENIWITKRRTKKFKTIKTQKNIKKITDNSKRHSNTKKNYDIKITKIKNFFQTSKSPNNKLYNTNSFSFNKEGCPNQKKKCDKKSKFRIY